MTQQPVDTLQLPPRGPRAAPSSSPLCPQPGLGIMPPICTEHGGIAEILHQSLAMSKDKSEVTGKILNLTLEIILLLTGEDFVLSRKQKEPPADACQPSLSEVSTKDPSPSEERQSPEETTEKETLEPGETPHSEAQEVPVRCQDVAVFFSMEEWEYMEGHKEHYKDVVSETPPPPASAGGRIPLKPRKSRTKPRASQKRLEGENRMEHQAPAGEGTLLRQCKEEDVPVEISSGGHILTTPPEGCTSPPVSQKCTEEDNRMITQEYQTPQGKETALRECKEEEVPVPISSVFPPGEQGSVDPPEIRGNHVFSPADAKEDYRTIPQESQAVNRDNVLPIRCKEEPNRSEINSGPPTSWKVQPDSPNVLVPVRHKNGECPSNPEGSVSSDVHPIAVIVKPQTVLNLIPTLKCKTDQPQMLWQEPHGAVSASSLMKLGDGNENVPSVVHECLQCGQSFGKEVDLIAHEQLLHCALCQQCFLEKSALVVHQWAFHMPRPITKDPQPKCATKEEGPFSCVECGKSFMNKSTYKRHQRIHTGAFTCPDCGKCLTDKTHLVRHRRTHTTERPFACSECGRRFSRKYHLITHQSVHKESYTCSDCGKRFSVKSILEAHQAFHNQFKSLNHSSAAGAPVK